MDDTLTPKCPDCQVAIREPHVDGCDVARCVLTGSQRLSCVDAFDEDDEPNLDHDCGQDIWTGLWPGVAECREYGLFCVMQPGSGWVPVAPGTPGAVEDLNSLVVRGRWDAERCRFVLDESASR